MVATAWPRSKGSETEPKGGTLPPSRRKEMAGGEAVARSKVKQKSEVQKRLAALLKRFGNNQAALARAAGVDPTRLSEWLRGEKKRKPTPEGLRLLGNVAPYPDNLWFWRESGLDEKALLEAAVKVLRERGAEPTPGEIVRVKTATHKLLPFPAEFIPNPASTRLLRILQNIPAYPFRSGDVLILDESDNDENTFKPFWGELILVEEQSPAAPSGSAMYLGTLELTGGLRFFGAELRIVGRDYVTRGQVIGGWEPRISSSKNVKLSLKDLWGEEHFKDVTQTLRQTAFKNVERFPNFRILGRVIGFHRLARKGEA